ncbi:hypothetical protein F7725_015554 [Dissostichus mawsoni]|uniref:Uncharacterized protein n=1 Tax=Dissostichus mawsoni TaxID=36200 RepID=A0A7J5YKP0_DISMA|nr:hypothetical protein F7725_015554 [Dissostichus mawsoni]
MDTFRMSQQGQILVIHSVKESSHVRDESESICVHQVHSSSTRFTDSCYDGLYPGHIHTTPIQKALLAVGSGVAALQNPYRHDTKSQGTVVSSHSAPRSYIVDGPSGTIRRTDTILSLFQRLYHTHLTLQHPAHHPNQITYAHKDIA